MQGTRSDGKADESREDHERHHPRLHQCNVIANRGKTRFRQAACGERPVEVCAFAGERHESYLIRGSVSNWWNGGGDDSVHSSVVAPTPHGLLPATRFFTKASIRPKKKMITPKPEIYEPYEETMFQPWNASG